MRSMKHALKAPPRRRLTLLPIEVRSAEGRPAIRRYRLGRVLDDIGLALAVPAVAGQAPDRGPRAP
jgi:hypothetical protein